MSTVYLICGKVCAGKTRYSEFLKEKTGGVSLSADELMLSIFDEDLGEKHEHYAKKAKEYLYKKSLELLNSGVTVIMDCGFWTKAERDFARRFYEGFSPKLVYVEVSKNRQLINAEKRNRELFEGKISAYFADEGLLKKCERLFEPPDDEEIFERYSDEREN